MRFFEQIKQIIVAGGDFLCFFFGLLIGLGIRNGTLPNGFTFQNHLELFFFLFILWLIINYVNGLYDSHINTNFKTLLTNEGIALSIAIVAGVTFFYLNPNSQIAPKTVLLLSAVAGYALSTIWHYLYFRFISAKTLRIPILFVGHTKEVEDILKVFSLRPSAIYDPVAIVDTQPHSPVTNIPLFKSLSELPDIIKKNKIQLVVVSPHLNEQPETLRTLYSLLFSNVEIVDLVSFYENITGRIPPSTFSEGWFFEHLRGHLKPLYEFFQLIMDLAAGLILTILTLILFPIVGLLIKLTSQGPILIKQPRVGKNGHTFLLYKFRSMYALSPDGSAETSGPRFAAPNDKRITPIGKILRRTHIDELPQSFNILKRDLSLIGPRPERPEIVLELTRRMPYYPLRHIIRPGLTGWAVIQQNYTDTYDKTLEKFQYDLYYIKNRSLFLDAAVFLKTINILLRLRGQ